MSLVFFCWFICVALTSTGHAQAQKPDILNDVGIDQKLNAQVPLDLMFKDEHGGEVRLGDYFGKRPVILTLVYYQCPMLCTMVLNDLVRSMNTLPIDAGKDFDIVTVSFNPHERPALALQKKEGYLQTYERPTAAAGWHFLTGTQASITALTQATGFRYTWDPVHQVYAHASGIMVLTPGGRIARYFFGIDYEPVDLRLSLIEAGGSKIGSPATQVLLYCFQYDPRTGRYGLIVSRLLQLLGVLTVAAVGGFVALSLWRDRARAPAAASHRG